MRIRLLLVDDEALVRRGLRMCIAGEPNLDVVGEAEEGAEAIALVAALHPDVVVMDMRMRGLDGLSATREILARSPRTRVVVLSMQDDARTRSAAKEAGAAAFVGKGEGIGRLLEVIRELAG